MPTADSAYTVLIVDDQPGFLALTKETLALDPRFTVVGTAANGEQAVALAAELKPQVAIVDVFMPGLNGFQTARRIAAVAPDTRIVIVSAEGYPEHPTLAREAGALAFLDKRDLRPRRLLQLLEAP